jgi:hypothetical protein
VDVDLQKEKEITIALKKIEESWSKEEIVEMLEELTKCF